MCVQCWEPLAASAPIDIESAGAVEVSCDGALVRRVMENFVSNGIRHTPAGSPMRISIASGDGPRASRGARPGARRASGSQREDLREVRDVEARQESSYHSVGLGLAFCKLAIEAHGGTIGVDPGVPAGSTFWFELPA